MFETNHNKIILYFQVILENIENILVTLKSYHIMVYEFSRITQRN